MISSESWQGLSSKEYSDLGDLTALELSERNLKGGGMGKYPVRGLTFVSAKEMQVLWH